MRFEIRSHSISKREAILGTATLIGPIFVIGAKSLVEQITNEQIKQMPKDSIPTNVDSGDSQNIFSEQEAYRH